MQNCLSYWNGSTLVLNNVRIGVLEFWKLVVVILIFCSRFVGVPLWALNIKINRQHLAIQHELDPIGPTLLKNPPVLGGAYCLPCGGWALGGPWTRNEIYSSCHNVWGFSIDLGHIHLHLAKNCQLLCNDNHLLWEALSHPWHWWHSFPLR